MDQIEHMVEEPPLDASSHDTACPHSLSIRWRHFGSYDCQRPVCPLSV